MASNVIIDLTMHEDDEDEVIFVREVRRANPKKPPTTSPITLDFISRMYRIDKSEKVETCSICLEDYEIGERVCKLACDHVFHKTCLQNAINNGIWKCALCRFDTIKIIKEFY